jgi:hypothetical protein
METAHKRDKDLQVYLTLGKRKYYAGDNVDGAVHILCRQDRP